MKVLLTGMAGFIGHSVAKQLLAHGYDVVGLDLIDDYYDVQYKYARLADLGFERERILDARYVRSATNGKCLFVKQDVSDREALERLFSDFSFDYVIHLAGQAGVRYSIENPYAYIRANINGFLNVLECCRHHPVRHLLYASSSSVYGEAESAPSVETDGTDCPVSLYAATKKSDELMAYAYAKLYGIPATAMRFFTVYGPWGRPDMAPMKFMRAVMQGEPITVYNNGQLSRDFTYIDDITTAILLLMESHGSQTLLRAAPSPVSPDCSTPPHAIYNIGHSSPVRLLDFIATIERVVGRKAVKQFVGMQRGDVHTTYADTSRLVRATGFQPQVSLEEGLRRQYEWLILTE